MLAHNQAYV